MIDIKKIKTVLLTAAAACCITLSATSAVYADAPAIYTVVKGDSLFLIGQVFQTNVDTLMKINSLKTVSLDIGQTLKVPSDTYTVKKGDTLFLLSKRLNIPLDQLRRANNIYTDELNINQVLNLPGTKPVDSLDSDADADLKTDMEKPVEAEDNTQDYSAYSPAEMNLLSRLIHAEAQGEPYQTKVAVGSVVVNRMESGQFPATIKEVIYQNINGYDQFTPVANGWIEKPANAEAEKAAKEALNGADPSMGALFYYDSGTTNAWILSRPVTVRIGNMIFAK